MKASESFTKRLSLKVLTSTISLVVVTLTCLSLLVYRSVTAAADKIAVSLLDTSIESLNIKFSSVENAVKNNVWPINEHLTNPDYAYHVTWRLLETNPEIIGSTVAFIPDFFPELGRWYAPYTYRAPETGEMMSIQMGGEHYDYHSMEWFSVPLQNSCSRWCKPYFDDGGGDQLMVTYSTPITVPGEGVVAIFTADVSLDDLKDELALIKPFKNSYAILLDGEGNYLCHPDSSYILKKNIITKSEASGDKEMGLLARKVVDGEKGNGKIRTNDGETFIISYGPLDNGWREAIITPYMGVYGRVTALIIIFELLAGVCLVLLYFTNKRIISRESQPITEFTYAALNLAQCKFDAHIPEVHTDDELRRLHDSLHYLERSISSYISELRATTSAKERIEGELSVASQIQMSMLPKNFPTEGGVDLNAVLHSAKEIGGDLYDFFIKDRVLYFAVGDVSGKGVPAALLMAITRSAFRFISSLDLPMEKVASLINSSLSDGNEQGMFVTLFLGRIDLDTLEMEYCNAGHNPIVVIEPDGSASFLKAKPNIAAGLFDDFPYQGESLNLRAGTRLILYTDGVTEAEDPEKGQYGEERLLDFAGSQPVCTSSEKMVLALASDVSLFTRGAEQNDDITIMSIRLQGGCE